MQPTPSWSLPAWRPYSVTELAWTGCSLSPLPLTLLSGLEEQRGAFLADLPASSSGHDIDAWVRGDEAPVIDSHPAAGILVPVRSDPGVVPLKRPMSGPWNHSGYRRLQHTGVMLERLRLRPLRG